MYNNPPKTLFIGQKLVFLPECHSTNDTAATLVQEPLTPEGTVVITNQQTRGRGQRGNGWIAEPGKNLTLSVIVKPTFLPIAQQFQLTVAVSLAVHEFLSQHISGGLAIKWPNDVYWHSHKMGGILIENTIQGSSITHSIIGIGLNINQIHFAENLRATSMALATRTGTKVDEYNLEILLPELLVSLEKFYLKLRAGDASSLKAHYLRKLYGYGEPQRFRASGEMFTGVIIGIDETGQLAVQQENTIRYFSFKEVEFLFAAP